MPIKPKFKIKRVHIETLAAYSRMFVVGLVTVVALYSFVVIFYGEFIVLQGDKLALQAHEPSPASSPSNISSLAISGKAAARYVGQTELFGHLEPPEPVKTAAPTKTTATTASNTLLLIGTFLSNSRDSYAIIQNKTKGEQEVFLKGDSVFDSGNLIEIAPGVVTLNKDGKTEQLFLEDGETTSAPVAGIDSTAETVVVSESDVQEALNNLPLLLTQARTVPYFSNGQRDGRRIFAIRSGSFFEKIGLVNGDIIKSINGTDLNDDSKALELFEEFKNARTLSLRLVRNREEKAITYERR
jgi:general secretion pathway protein C